MQTEIGVDAHAIRIDDVLINLSRILDARAGIVIDAVIMSGTSAANSVEIIVNRVRHHLDA